MRSIARQFSASAAVPVLAALALAVTGAPAAAQQAEAGQELPPDNGTDPTRVSRLADAKYEHLDLRHGLDSGVLRLSYLVPFGARQDYGLRFSVPVQRLRGVGNDDYDLGDASLRVNHVFGMSRRGAFVAQGELVFDTADRAELGTGKTVFKGTLIYARFLADGGIFAPAWVQSNSLSGQSGRAPVSTTTLDFYYVPKMQDARNLLTYDPAISFDWQSDRSYASLAVTAGRVLGPAFGGNAIVFLKPTLFAGGERPGNWGFEVGYRVIGF